MKSIQYVSAKNTKRKKKEKKKKKRKKTYPCESSVPFSALSTCENHCRSSSRV